MKLNVHRGQRERGIAVVLVLILVLLMSSLIALNNKALSGLNQELRRIEEKQKMKFKANAANDEKEANPAAQK